jgi:malonyl-CoA/methylmalonyl-CoA synthetase
VTLSLITRAQQQADRTAIVSAEGTFTYGDLLRISGQFATHLLDSTPDLNGQRVAFMIPSGFPHVAVQWAIWRSGGVAVPLCISYPAPELDYVIGQSGATIVVGHPEFEALLRPIAEARSLRWISTSDLNGSEVKPLPEIATDRPALMLYTSGTTGKPKGVVTTHHNLESQVTSLVTAWEWMPDDRILHVLPLHHIHGIVNVLTCALWVGAECHLCAKFDTAKVWDRIGAGDLTLFMAVPTIYAKLITAWQTLPIDRQEILSAGCQKMRLMVSGSAALPIQVLDQWQQISGHFLLERYGMTEIGMALSNPLQGERRSGFVGNPLPQVQVRLWAESGAVTEPDVPGEIQVKGPGVFLEYWQNPEATAKAFSDGWFCTGDLAVLERGAYRILGRMSVDIIKTGGYKVSALEIEEVLRTHPMIQDCAVVGVADAEWGEQVCAALVLRSGVLQSGQTLGLSDLRAWAKAQVAVYKVPSRISIVDELPRNAMGKVMKPKVVAFFE